MPVEEVQAKSILRRHKRVESWFVSCCGMNLYRGCSHNCVYCDGRAEGYYVEGEFDRDVAVKVNAPELLRRELDPARKRKPMDSGYVCLGGGVGDAYQPADEKYELARSALALIHEFQYPVHILTKSTHVERDLDIIKKINRDRGAVVSFSYSSVDDDISRIFEPGVPPPSERLALQARIRKEGIACGMFLMPVIPFITDLPESLNAALEAAKRAGIDFVMFSGLTLKRGRQKEYFYRTLDEHYPELIPEYAAVYRDEKWGGAIRSYSDSLHGIFHELARRHDMPTRVPLGLLRSVLSTDDLVIILLEHMDHLLRVRGRSSPYGYAAYSISQSKEPLQSMRRELRSLKGVGPGTERIIKEILNTGTSGYYERLMKGL